MTPHVDPLRRLRPIPDDELEALGDERRQRTAGPLDYDVYRIGDQLVIELDIPGVDPSDVELAVEDRTLVVRCSRPLARGAGVDVVEAGRQHGTFTRRLFLGDRWDLDRISASTRHGVLTVRAPLVALRTSRRIDVTDGPARDEAMPTWHVAPAGPDTTTGDEWFEVTAPAHSAA